MGKRFGRNQKRKMRELLAAEVARSESLRGALEMDRALLARQRLHIESLQESITSIANEVGYQSALLGVKCEMPHGFDGMRFSPVMPVRVTEFGGNAPYEEITYEVIRLLNVKAVRDRFHGQIHIKTTLAGGNVAYGISEHALRSMSPEFLERRIAHELTHCLVKAVKEAA